MSRTRRSESPPAPGTTGGADDTQEKYRTLLDQASDAMWVIDADGRFTDVNARGCELLGYTREEALRLSVYDVIVPEALAEKPLALDEMRAGRIITNERHVRRRDGSVFLAETTSRGLLGGGAFGIVRDVTERRRAEEALRASEERLRRVVESDLFGVTFAERTGRVSYANPYTLQMLGRTREDVDAGRVLWNDITLPEDGELDAQLNLELATTGAIRPIERRLRHADGRIIPALVGAALLKPAHDVIVGFLLDLTELKGVQRRLAESERLLERAQALARVGFATTDLASRTSVFSRELVDILGLPPGTREIGEIEGLDLIHPEDRAWVEAIVQRLGTEDLVRYEHRVRRPDGTVRVVEVISEALRDADGRATNLLSSVQDITERRQLEEQLREAQKLEAVGRLAGGVAHDFNNLLTVILGSAEILDQALQPHDRRRSNVEEILGAARRAAGLTQQLLAFGRQTVLQARVFDLHVAVRELRPIIQRLVGPAVEVTIDEGAGCSLILADRDKIERVILNLVLNARDAMENGGRLTIATADFTDRASRSCIVLTVTDDGAGMSPEVQSHIFEPFYTTKDVGHGTGLGLAMAYGIVTQSGGSIAVSSEPGHGSTFRVELPCAEGPVDADTPNADAASGGGRETVLLVEDERPVREMLTTALRTRGYQVIAAAEAEEALRLDRDVQVDLLVTDVLMPGMLGTELARRLQADRPRMNVLFVSGFSGTSDEPGADLAGGAFLSKPFGSDLFARKVREVLDARAAAGGKVTGHATPPEV